MNTIETAQNFLAADQTANVVQEGYYMSLGETMIAVAGSLAIAGALVVSFIFVADKLSSRKSGNHTNHAE